MKSLAPFRSGKPNCYPDQSVYSEYACAEFGLTFQDMNGGTGLVFSVASPTKTVHFGAGRCSYYPQNNATASTLASDKYFTNTILARAGVATLGGSGLDRFALAAAGRRAENEVVGAPVGIMDQAASLLCREGSALLLDCRSMATQDVALGLAEAGLGILVVDSRVRHDLADGGYADRHAACVTAAAALGVHGLLVVTPYYNKPPQAGLLRHFTSIADSTDLPVMLYDIPPRSVVPIEVETLVRAAEHPKIVAVKDAKGDLGAVAWTLARTDLAYYSGEDMLNLPLLALGAVGVVSVVGHLVGPRLAELIAAVESGDLVKARAVNESLLPVYTGIFRTQGVILVKAALRELGLPAGPVRPPLVDATPEQIAQLRTDLAAGGVPL